jgi:hypothetical protein
MAALMTDLHEKIRKLETDLREQGIALFPNTRSGQHAELLWRKIKRHLFRGGAVQIRRGVLKLDLHREELRRARSVLIQMELIKSRIDGLYVLGRYDWLDQEVRDRFFELKLAEALLVYLSAFVPKSKTHALTGRPRPSHPTTSVEKEAKT